MAKYEQIVQPRLDTVSGAGWCLNFAQKFFGTPHLFASAWQAYQATVRKQTGALPTGAAVVLWFEHWGTYQGVYANWGHVAIHVPGKGIYTSPWFSSYGQEIYQSIGEIERIFHARYVGWTDNISHVRIAEPVKSNKPAPDSGQEEDDDMYKPTVHYRTSGGGEWTLAHPEIGLDLTPGQSRKDGKVTVFRGYEATTDSKVGGAWARMFARGIGGETSRTDRSGYMEIQAEATRLSVEFARKER